MLKFNKKIKRTLALLALASYVFIILINAVHFHKINIGNTFSIINLDNSNQSSAHSINGSTDFCTIQTAYNSLQNTLVSFANPYQNIEQNKNLITVQIVTARPLKTNTHQHPLRAPPTIT